MSLRKIMTYVIFLSIIMLSGCSDKNNVKIDQMSSNFQKINAKINKINKDINLLRIELRNIKKYSYYINSNKHLIR